MSYKRNQIEEAIARIFVPNCEEPPSELRTRIKRLLDLDRSIGRKLRSKDAEEANFGFFSEEAPGTGADIWFSEYEAFALLNGLRIMGHRWPRASQFQSCAASVSISKGSTRGSSGNIRTNYSIRNDTRKSPPRRNRCRQYGSVFLTLASKAQRAPDEGQTAPLSAVCHGLKKVSEFSRDVGASSVSMFEVATLAHRLHQELMKTEPRRRGRG